MINKTLLQIQKDLAEKKVTSVELTKAILAQIEAKKDLNAFVTVCADEALTAAAEADRRIAAGESAPLLGVPVAVKDNICTEGIKTTCASKFLDNYIPPYDAFVVKKLKQAGAVIVGKANMDEFAMGSASEFSAYGAVKNAVDPTRVPGGSSGGSASCVASYQAYMALGSDTGGSIRQPAAFNGVVGLKPTYSAVSRYGLIAFASSLDQIGPITRTVEDCEYVYNIIKGYDKMDSTSFSGNLAQGEKFDDLKGKKIGIATEFFPDTLSGETRDAINKAIETYKRMGAEIVDVSIKSFDMALACYYILSSAEATSNLSRYDGIKYGQRSKGCKNLSDIYYKSRTEFFGDEVKRRIMLGNFVLSSGYYDAFYLRASKARTLIKADFEAALEKCDALLCPVAPTTAFKLGEKHANPADVYLADIFTVPVNIAGLPGLSLKCGEDAAGLPIGMQLIGKAYHEDTLFSFGKAFEKTQA